MADVTTPGNPSNQNEDDSSKSIKGKNPKLISKLSQQEIIRFFNTLHKEKRKIIIPVGFPKAGKSLFLSSLLYYCAKDPHKPFLTKNLESEYYLAGHHARNQMVKYFNEREAYPANKAGTIDLIGVDIEPKKKSLPKLRLGVLDLAGEDLEKILLDEREAINDTLDGILKACNKVGAVFCLITPYRKNEFKKSGEDASYRSDEEEDQLQSDFINYLKNNHQGLLSNSQFIVLVTQWDENNEEDMKSVEQYIEERRPGLHGAIHSDFNLVYGAYSVGDVIETKDSEGKEYILISEIDSDYPKEFWSNLYTILTGKKFKSGFWNWLKSLFN